jgi:hypothetical protein
MVSFWSFPGWLRVPLSLEVRVSFRYGLRVFGLYRLRGAGGVAAGLSCAQSGTGATA